MKIFILFALFMMCQAARFSDIPRKMMPVYRQQDFRQSNLNGQEPVEERNFYRSFPENRQQREPEDSQFYRETPRIPHYSETPNFSIERDRELKYQPISYKTALHPLTYTPSIYYGYMTHHLPKTFGSHHYQLF